MPIWVPDADGFANYQKIERDLNEYADDIADRINTADLGGWVLTINIESRRANNIGIFKKLTRYPSDNEFVATIGLPLPYSDQVPYGLDRKLEVVFISHDEKYFHTIEPMYESYSSLEEYIYKASIRALDAAFSIGFTANGNRIKYQR
jgi:hypothetical protein